MKLFKRKNKAEENKMPVQTKSNKPAKRTMPEVNGKEQYKLEKEKRKKQAEENRIIEEQQKIEEEKEKLREIELQREEKKKIAEEKALEAKKQANENKKVKEVKHEEKKDNILDLYGFDIVEHKKGDITKIEILAIERDNYLAQSTTNSQDILLPKIEVENLEVNVGDEIEVLIFKYYAEQLYASQRRLQNKRNLETELEKVKEEEVVKGTVLSYKEPFFIVELDNKLRGKVFIRNIDTKFVSDPVPYLEKTFEFTIKEKIYNNHNFQFELDRRSLINKNQKEIISNIKVDQVLTIDDYNFNKGGIEFYYNSVRGFVPISELSHKFYRSIEDAKKDITGPQEIKIKEIENKRGSVNILGSIKALTDNPWDVFVEEVKVDDEISGEVVRIENYGIFINLGTNIYGLLHTSEFNSELATDTKDIKLGQEVHCLIKEIDENGKKVSLKMK